MKYRHNWWRSSTIISMETIKWCVSQKKSKVKYTTYNYWCKQNLVLSLFDYRRHSVLYWGVEIKIHTVAQRWVFERSSFQHFKMWGLFFTSFLFDKYWAATDAFHILSMGLGCFIYQYFSLWFAHHDALSVVQFEWIPVWITKHCLSSIVYCCPLSLLFWGGSKVFCIASMWSFQSQMAHFCKEEMKYADKYSCRP
jgi:hypothetical protein